MHTVQFPCANRVQLAPDALTCLFRSMSESFAPTPATLVAGPFAELSAETRDALTEVARSLARGAALSGVGGDIENAARACVADARLGTARAEVLVRELKREWNACVVANGLAKHTADRAIERLVTAAIVEFYRAV